MSDNRASTNRTTLCHSLSPDHQDTKQLQHPDHIHNLPSFTSPRRTSSYLNPASLEPQKAAHDTFMSCLVVSCSRTSITSRTSTPLMPTSTGRPFSVCVLCDVFSGSSYEFSRETAYDDGVLWSSAVISHTVGVGDERDVGLAVGVPVDKGFISMVGSARVG